MYENLNIMDLLYLDSINPLLENFNVEDYVYIYSLRVKTIIKPFQKKRF
jgi:hypothetical protein